jgi:hypothetical protein
MAVFITPSTASPLLSNEIPQISHLEIDLQRVIHFLVGKNINVCSCEHTHTHTPEIVTFGQRQH